MSEFNELPRSKQTGLPVLSWFPLYLVFGFWFLVGLGALPGLAANNGSPRSIISSTFELDSGTGWESIPLRSSLSRVSLSLDAVVGGEVDELEEDVGWLLSCLEGVIVVEGWELEEELVDKPGTTIGTKFSVLHCIRIFFKRCGFWPLMSSFVFGFGFLVGMVNSCSSEISEEHGSLRSCLSTCLLDTAAGWWSIPHRSPRSCLSTRSLDTIEDVMVGDVDELEEELGWSISCIEGVMDVEECQLEEELVDKPGTTTGTKFSVLHCIRIPFSIWCVFWPLIHSCEYPCSPQSFPSDKTAGVSSRTFIVMNISNSLTYTIASSCVCTSPLAVKTIAGLHDFVKVSISASLKSFLLIMCIDAPESTTNSLSSVWRLDASRHLFSRKWEECCFVFLL